MFRMPAIGTAMPSVDNLVVLAAALGNSLDEIIVIDRKLASTMPWQ